MAVAPLRSRGRFAVRVVAVLLAMSNWTVWLKGDGSILAENSAGTFRLTSDGKIYHSGPEVLLGTAAGRRVACVGDLVAVTVPQLLSAAPGAPSSAGASGAAHRAPAIREYRTPCRFQPGKAVGPGRHVPIGDMSDFILDRPPDKRRNQVPLFVIEPGNDSVQSFLLVM